MAAFLTVEYRVDKKDDFAALVERALEAFKAAGEEPRISFRFCDAPAGFGSAGGIDRLLKAYPAFASFRQDSLVANGESADQFIEPAVLLEVARGVPRRFGFHQAALFFQAPILDRAPEETLVLEAAATAGIRQLRRVVSTPGVTVVSSWWTPRRLNSLSATVKLRDAEDAPPPLLELLDNLGRKKSEHRFVLPSSAADAKKSAAKSSAADEAFAAGKASLRDRWRSLALAALIERGLPRPGEQLPLRERVAAALKPLHYRSTASHATGIVRFVKAGASGAPDIVLDIDRGTWSKSCMAMVEIRAQDWSRRTALPLSAEGTLRQYPLLDEAQVTLIASNLAAALAAFEDLVYRPVAAALISE